MHNSRAAHQLPLITCCRHCSNSLNLNLNLNNSLNGTPRHLQQCKVSSSAACAQTITPIAEHTSQLCKSSLETCPWRFAVHYHFNTYGSRALSHTPFDIPECFWRSLFRYPFRFYCMASPPFPLLSYYSSCLGWAVQQVTDLLLWLLPAGEPHQMQMLRSTGYPGYCLVFSMASRIVPCSSGVSYESG